MPKLQNERYEAPLIGYLCQELCQIVSLLNKKNSKNIYVEKNTLSGR